MESINEEFDRIENHIKLTNCKEMKIFHPLLEDTKVKIEMIGYDIVPLNPFKEKGVHFLLIKT